MNLSSPDTRRAHHHNGKWTEGDDKHGVSATRFRCGHCNLTILRPSHAPFLTNGHQAPSPVGTLFATSAFTSASRHPRSVCIPITFELPAP